MIRGWTLLVLVLGVGCSDNTNGNSDLGDAGLLGGDGGCWTVAAASKLDPLLVAAGSALVTANNCQQCHGQNLSGNFDGVMFPGHSMPAYPPNLTTDPMTGLGCWTNDQIVDAILNGVDNQGQPLCPPMPHFSSMGMTKADAIAIAYFLHTLPAEVNQVPDTPACQAWGAEGGGCNVDTDCPMGDVCSYQFCVQPGDMGVPDLSMPPTDGSMDGFQVVDMSHPHPDLAHPPPDGGVCTTASVTVSSAPSPAITFGTLQLSAMVTNNGCAPLEQSFAWSFNSIPASSKSAFNDATVSDPSFVPDVANGTWSVHLKYSNVDSGQTFDVDARVTSNDCYASPPVAQIQTVLPSTSATFADSTPFGGATDASPFGPADLTFAVGTGVQVSGLPSADPTAIAACGMVPPLSYAWTLVAEPPGSTAHLSMASGPVSNATLDVAGRYVIGLSVSNGVLGSAPAYLRIDAM
jgi:hypothetical protein